MAIPETVYESTQHEIPGIIHNNWKKVGEDTWMGCDIMITDIMIGLSNWTHD